MQAAIAMLVAGLSMIVEVFVFTKPLLLQSMAFAGQL